MGALKEVQAIIRKECLPELVEVLNTLGVSRFYVSRVHALGVGVDPRAFKVSLDEGAAYTEKARVDLICDAEKVEDILTALRRCATTGQRGDGILTVRPVEEVVSVRTGDRGPLALL